MKMEIKKVPRLLKKKVTDAFCVDDCIYTYACCHNIEYELAYLGALRTPYIIQNNELILNSLDLWDEFRDVGGICIEYAKWENNTELLNWIREQINNGNTVVIDLLGYYCPWDWRYKEINLSGSSHEFFIVGINDKKREFICVDPYYEKMDVILSYEECVKGCEEAKVLKYERHYLNETSLIRKLYLEKANWDKSFDDLNSLSNMIFPYMKATIDSIDIDSGLKSTYVEVNENVVYCIMEELSNNCVRFSIFLKYLKKRKILLDSKFTKEFVNISQMWNNIKNILVKSMYRKQINIEGLKVKIEEICTYERMILEKILVSIHEPFVRNVNDNPVIQIHKDESYWIYNISKYCNNKGVLHNINNRADFNGFGEYFELNNFPMGQIVYYQNIPFYFGEICDYRENKDNIVCMNQVLCIPGRRYTKICFLACSDWEECGEIFELRYVDGTIENVFVNILEWVPDRNKIKDNYCFLSRKKIRNTRDEYENCYIYYYEVLCDFNKILTDIKLPNCENIHVFAITLVSKVLDL